MRLAIISTAGEDWEETAQFAENLHASLSGFQGLEPSFWLLDDEPAQHSFASLTPGKARLHLLELQGRHSPNRAFSTALGYLVCERDEQFDAFLLLTRTPEPSTAQVSALLENAVLNPGSVHFAKTDPRGLRWSARFTRGALTLLTRALTGERLENSSLTYLPLRAAEALSHSGRAGSHLEAAMRHLGVARSCSRSARAPALPLTPLGMLEELSVFRERVFSRSFGFSAALLALSFALALAGTAVAIFKAHATALLLLWLFPPLFALLAAISVLLGLAAQALNESRRWTPALDSTLLLRSVKRVKRGPELVENGSRRESRSAASSSQQWRDPLSLHRPPMRI